jgi:tetratricopeptide (TPR) repeat protein
MSPSSDTSVRVKTTYSLSEVAKLLGLEPAQVAALSGLAHGQPRDLFGFADLVLLRAAKALSAQQLPKDGLIEALKKLSARLPDGAGATAVALTRQGEQLVVAIGDQQWNARDGQGVFGFNRAPAPSWIQPSALMDAEGLFQQAIALEENHPAEAVDRYTEALAQNPRHADAHVNLGRLLHTRGRLGEAEAHYVASLVCRPNDCTATFNLAVVLEDLGRVDEAIARYTEALGIDAGCVDAYFNLSRLYEKKGEKVAALRHLKDYRRLLRSS